MNSKHVAAIRIEHSNAELSAQSQILFKVVNVMRTQSVTST